MHDTAKVAEKIGAKLGGTMREALEAIEHALKMGFSPAEVLDENSPIRSGIRTALAEGRAHGEAAATMTDFERGALVALAVLVQAHDQPGMAANIVLDMGLEHVDVSEMADLDRAVMRRLQGLMGGRINFRGLSKRRSAPPVKSNG